VKPGIQHPFETRSGTFSGPQSLNLRLRGALASIYDAAPLVSIEQGTRIAGGFLVPLIIYQATIVPDHLSVRHRAIHADTPSANLLPERKNTRARPYPNNHLLSSAESLHRQFPFASGMEPVKEFTGPHKLWRRSGPSIAKTKHLEVAIAVKSDKASQFRMESIAEYIFSTGNSTMHLSLTSPRRHDKVPFEPMAFVL